MCSLILIDIAPLGKAQASGTTVSRLIMLQDTTWTKSGSPYTFQGLVGVAEGVTLTLEAGVTVNIGTYCLTINGTLKAQRTNVDPIHINAVDSAFAALVLNVFDSSNGTSSIIENAVVSTYSLQAYSGSPIFRNDFLTGSTM